MPLGCALRCVRSSSTIDGHFDSAATTSRSPAAVVFGAPEISQRPGSEAQLVRSVADVGKLPDVLGAQVLAGLRRAMRAAARSRAAATRAAAAASPLSAAARTAWALSAAAALCF